jgi:hypothetical protein
MQPPLSLMKSGRQGHIVFSGSIAPHQKNALLRIVIRDLERTLTSDEANVLRDDIYAASHEGSAKSWAARRESP